MVMDFKTTASLTLTLLSLFFSPMGWAGPEDEEEEEPEYATLLILQFENFREGDNEEAMVEFRPGPVESPFAGKPFDRVRIEFAETSYFPEEQQDRSVYLYRNNKDKRLLLASIQIRFYDEGDKGWVPHFKIQQDITLIRQGDKWLPIPTAPGASNVVMLTSSSIPNTEGYYSYLEFSFSPKQIYIDSWEVK
ncbi:MAG: hypothetical protein BMS9Abin36_2168 [Gammaproteobacteria bacterium]|nr:MAG: hypothetical protein BMS9Abin36_2168 [Gammaproteobacteria bacterium]